MPPTAKTPCRHCGGTELYSREVDASGGNGPDLLPIGGFLLTAPRLIVQVCGQCGLVEWFVPSRLLEQVKKKFQRVWN